VVRYELISPDQGQANAFTLEPNAAVSKLPRTGEFGCGGRGRDTTSNHF
jgi:hypothetical protein